MDFSLHWIQALSKGAQMTETMGPKMISSSPLKFTSTPFLNTLHMDQGLMPWLLSRGWVGPKALFNFLTNRKNAAFTTEESAKFNISWRKSRRIVDAFHGLLCQTNRQKRLGSTSNKIVNLLRLFFQTGKVLLWPRKGGLHRKWNSERRQLFGPLQWALCWYSRWLLETHYYGPWAASDERCILS